MGRSQPPTTAWMQGEAGEMAGQLALVIDTANTGSARSSLLAGSVIPS